MAKLRFEKGDSSLLNSASVLDWPELRVDDVQALYARECADNELGSETVRHILEHSGGHPQLLRRCFQLHRQGTTPAALFSRHPALATAFGPCVSIRNKPTVQSRRAERGVISGCVPGLRDNTPLTTELSKAAEPEGVLSLAVSPD
ncbi:MAG: hypothetical protein GY862_01450 [Gammaproteobacteria bacterium]|nr:hypothetical protein [Gammaproteobacteria bacterium]